MRCRPTRGALAAVLAAVLLDLLTRVTGDAWLALLSGAALAVPLAALALRPGLAGLEVEVRGPERVVAGAAVVQQLVVRSTGRRRTPALTWGDPGGGLSPATAAVPALAAGTEVVLSLTRTAGPRGEHASSPVVVSTTAPFGVVRWSRALPPERTLLVHPVTSVGRALRGSGTTVGAAASTAAVGPGLEVLGLRPWRPGDSTRGISARASARHDRPVVLERERDGGPALCVVVDATGPGAAWEEHVSRAASLALAALERARPVLLVAGDGGPASGTPRRPVEVLDFFARVDQAGPLGAEAVSAAQRHAQQGGELVLLLGAGALGGLPGLSAARVEVLRG